MPIKRTSLGKAEAKSCRPVLASKSEAAEYKPGSWRTKKGDDSKSAVAPAAHSNKGKKRAGSREDKPRKKKLKAGEPEIQGEGDSADEADQGADPSSTEPGADTGATDTANPNHIELKTKEQIAWETKEAKRSGARQALARKQRKDLAVEAVKGGNAVPRGICMAYWARDGCKMVKGRCPRNFKHLKGYCGVGIPAHLRKGVCSGNPCKFGAAKCLFRHKDEPTTDDEEGGDIQIEVAIEGHNRSAKKKKTKKSKATTGVDN